MRILLLFFFVLGSVCHAELRTWTAVNGKEVEAEFVSNEKGIVKLKLKSGKIFEVPIAKLSKEDNEFISYLAKPDGVPEEKLERRKGIIYLKGSDTPYTGKSFELNENGQKKGEVNMKDGKPDGLVFGWYEDGQKKGEGNYKDGKHDGLTVVWHEDGQKKGEANYKNGKLSGRHVGWYENGKKKGEANYKNGKHDGLGVAWHSNGQKKGEVNWKDGKKEGLVVAWHENGKKKAEATYKDGEKVEGFAKYWNSKGEPVDSIGESNK